MTTLQFTVPDELALRAENEGLLNDSAIQQLLEDAIRRSAGRRLLEIGQRLQDASVPPMSEDEIAAEVRAVRLARSKA